MYHISIRLGEFERNITAIGNKELAVKFAHNYSKKENIPVYMKHTTKGTLSIFYPKKGDA